MMESMLALLPPREPERLLIRTFFPARRPNVIRDHEAVQVDCARHVHIRSGGVGAPLANNYLGP